MAETPSPPAELSPTEDPKVEWRPKNANFFDDGGISFIWKRHTLLVLALVMSYLVYVAILQENSGDYVQNTKAGLAVASCMFLLTGVTQFNDGPFSRPHPAVWRLVLATSVLYWLYLVFILFQTPEHARSLMSYLDPTLGVPLQQHTYATNCDIYDPAHPSGNPYENFMEKLDIFVIGHALGWLVKALIIRNAIICHALSITFELLEYTLEPQMPNFGECWWDHWVLDVLVCNAIGIHLGMWACQYLAVKEYRWKGFWNITSYAGRAKRLLQQFTPYYWTSFEWRSLQDLRTWLVTMMVFCLVMAIDLSAFYLKDVLWVPANHRFNIYRLLVITPASAVATRELFQYARDPKCVRFGQQAWVLIFVIATEFLVSYKFGAHISQRGRTDPFWLYFWAGAGILLVLWTLVYFVVIPIVTKRPRTDSTTEDSHQLFAKKTH